MSDKLIMAVPSKGRLQEQTNGFFERAGMKVLREGGERDYRGRLSGVDGVEIWFLSASEIAKLLGTGEVHIGVTGEDLIREAMPEPEARVHFITPLGFGRADVVVAVPQAWIDVNTVADLDDVASDYRARYGRWLRVATKYINITRGFFAEHKLGDYRIVESSGATEAAPASGVADVIVDITSSGATLKANGLKVLQDGVMLRSQANLIASRSANWGAVELATLTSILRRVDGEIEARNLVALRVAGLGSRDVDLAQFGASLPFGGGAETFTVHCPKANASALVDMLMEYGATTVSLSQVEDVFVAENELLARTLARLTSA